MGKRKKQTSTVHFHFLLASLLVVVILGILGIQLPDTLQDIFDSSTVQPSLPANQSETSTTNPGPQELGAATFTENELSNQNKGWITYHALDSLGRATGADALLKPNMVNTGTPANKDIRPAGFISGAAPTNHSRGHLIGRQLGGSGDDSRNLTTLYQNPVNTPYMTKYENMVRKALDNGETIRYRVTPVYEGSDLLCKKIEIEAKGIETHSTIDFHVSILNIK